MWCQFTWRFQHKRVLLTTDAQATTMDNGRRTSVRGSSSTDTVNGSSRAKNLKIDNSSSNKHGPLFSNWFVEFSSSWLNRDEMFSRVQCGMGCWESTLIENGIDLTCYIITKTIKTIGCSHLTFIQVKNRWEHISTRHMLLMITIRRDWKLERVHLITPSQKTYTGR